MTSLITLFVGIISGFIAHAVAMKVSFKQNTINNKIKVFDSLIAQWVEARNFIYSQLLTDHSKRSVFDTMYGKSQAFIGEAILISEDDELTSDINKLNERMFHTDWMNSTSENQDKNMEEIKVEAIKIISRMREDVKSSTIFDLQDFIHIFSGFFKRK